MSDSLAKAADLLRNGKILAAETLLAEARRQAPERPELAFGQAIVAREAGRPEAAIDYFRQTLALDPGHLPALAHFAAALSPDQAIPLLIRVVYLAPGQPAHWIALSQGYRNARHYGAAFAAAEAALRFAPFDGDALAARGVAHHTLGRLEAARQDLASALALAPSRRDHWINLSLVSSEASRLDCAAREMRRAVSLEPGRGDAEWGLALVHWLSGDLAQAWSSFEGRLLRRGIVRPRIAAAPKWSGEDFAGKTLLIWAEQGQGDSLQFIRYYDAIKARGGRVIIEVQASLKRLFEAQGRFDAVYAKDQIGEAFDLQMAMMSAPVIFGTTAQSVPWSGPYLKAPGAYKLPPRPGLKVGLVWAGNPENATADRLRSFDPATYEPLFGIADVSFYALQLGEAAISPRPDLVDLAPELDDFATTADALSGLDLLISSCTSVPHLAGAMGKPVWLLLNKASDYRWGLHGRSTPWYPTFRLYRQSRLRDWSAPIAAVTADLEELARARLQE